MFHKRLVISVLISLSLAAPSAYALTTGTPAVAASKTAQISQSININKATLEDLMKIKGMSKAKANNILAYRTEHSGFKSLDELKNVKGFKKMNKEKREAMQAQLGV